MIGRVGAGKLGIDLDFTTRNDRLELSDGRIEITEVNRPIPKFPLLFLQNGALSLTGLTEGDPEPIALTGEVEVSLGPDIGGNRLASFDGALRISENGIRLMGMGEMLPISFSVDLGRLFGEIDLGQTVLLRNDGLRELDWAQGVLRYDVTTTVLDGFFQNRIGFEITSNFDFAARAGGMLTIPDALPASIGGGKTLAGGQVRVKFTNDGNPANDYVAGWAQLGDKVDFGLGEVDLSVTTGLRIGFDGRVDVIGSDEIASVDFLREGANESVGAVPPTPLLIDGTEPLVLLTAVWEVPAPGAEVVVIPPDGRRLTEVEFAANGIAVVEGLSDATSRTVAVDGPAAGLWQIAPAEPEGLGAIGATGRVPDTPPALSFPVDPIAELAPDLLELAFEVAGLDEMAEAEIAFFYDDDPLALDGRYIGSVVARNGSGTLLWDTGAVPEGSYTVYGLLDRGVGVPVTGILDEPVAAGSATDLGVSIAARQESVPTEAAIYAVRVENPSPESAARAIELIVELPEGREPLNVSAPFALSDAGELVFALGDLPAGAEAVVEIALAEPADPTPLSVSARIESETFDPVFDNDATRLDRLSGDPLARRLTGGDEADSLEGSGEPDTLAGGGGDDLLRGLGGSDVIDGGSGDDTIAGGPGDDVLAGGRGADVFSAEGLTDLDGDRISDFALGDAIVIEDLAPEELELSISVEGDASRLSLFDGSGGAAEVTLSGSLDGLLVADDGTGQALIRLSSTYLPPEGVIRGVTREDAIAFGTGVTYLPRGGDDLFLISEAAVAGEAAVLEAAAGDRVQLAPGLEIVAFALSSSGMSLDLANGARVQVLGAANAEIEAGGNVTTGELGAVSSFADFADTVLGTPLPVSGTIERGFVTIPDAIATDSGGSVLGEPSGSAGIIRGVSRDDVLLIGAGATYLGRAGADTHIVSQAATPGETAVIEGDGDDIVQLVGGLEIESFVLTPDALQLDLATGARVQILNADLYDWEAGANATTGTRVTATDFATFAEDVLGVPLPGGGFEEGGPVTIPEPGASLIEGLGSQDLI